MSEVNEILKQLKAHCPGEAFHAKNKTHAELIANRFMDFTATLIGELETLTADLDTAEEACADLMTLNDKLTGEVDRLRRLISEAIEAINPNIIDNLLFEAINPHQYALLQPDALKATK